MTWFAAVPAVAAAFVLLLAPGVLMLAPLRLGFVARSAAAGLGSVLCLGLAGVAAGALGLAFAPWQVLVPAAGAAGVVWFVARRRIGVRVAAESSGWRWLALAWLLAGGVIAVVAFAAVPSPDRVSQTYDNVFHMSAIASILDGGSASSLTLRTLIETDRPFGFYPAAWHTLVAAVTQTTGAAPAVAANAAWLAVAAVVWVPGAAWLAQVLLRRSPALAVGLVALPLGAAFAAMPFSLLSWGSLYPTFLGTALLPAAVAIPILAGRAVRDTRGPRRWRAFALGVLGVSASIFAIAFSQPRVLASWALLLAPAVLWAGVSATRLAWRAGGAARRRAVWSLVAAGGMLALTAAAAFAYLVVALDLFARPLETRLNGPQAAATQSVTAGLWQVMSQSMPTGVDAVVTWPAVLLAVSVAAGALFASRTPELRWVVVSYLAVAVLFAVAAGSDDVAARLATALWYKDRYRLSSVLPVLGVTLATTGLLGASALVGGRLNRRLRRPTSLIASWAVALSSAVALLAGGAATSIGTVFRMPEADARTEVVSAAQIDFYERLAEVVPADQRVLGDPWDGSAWTQLYGDREPVFPHVNGQWDAARLTLAYSLADVETDPAVCAALDEVRVRYVVYDPHALGGGDPSGNRFPAPHRAVEAGLFTEVASDGSTALYRIDQCGELP